MEILRDDHWSYIVEVRPGRKFYLLMKGISVLVISGVSSGKMVENSNSDLLRRKISSIVALTEDEEKALARLPMAIRLIPARQDIACHGDKPSHCCLVLTGFAFRYKSFGNGQRQILNFHVPGDMPDLQSLHLPRMDHNLAAIPFVFATGYGTVGVEADFPGVPVVSKPFTTDRLDEVLARVRAGSV